MKHVMLWACGLLTFVAVGCGSENSSENASAVGGTPNFGGAAGTETTGTVGGTTSNTTAVTGGGTTAVVATTGAGKVAINEVVPSNKTGAIDEGGAYPDWVELYNASANDVSLAGYYLSDDPADPTKGAMAASLTIKAGGVLILWADGDIEQGSAHLPFSLAAGGEGLYLYDAEQKLIDSVEWGVASADTSYSRNPDGTGAFTWCSTPTPNKANGATCGG